MVQLGISLVVIFGLISIICFIIFIIFSKAYKHFDEITDEILEQFPMYTEEDILRVILKTRKNSILFCLISLLFILSGILFITL